MESLTSKTVPQSILKEGVRRNLKGIAAFVENAAFAEKSFSPGCLRGKAFTVSGPIDEPRISDAYGDVKGLIHVGGEMCNSWTTNYELHTFMAGAMLAAAATALRANFKSYRSADYTVRRELIKHDLRSLDESELFAAFQRPAYGILSQFVDDIEADRYAKAHLWGMEQESSRRFVQNIRAGDLSRRNHFTPTELFTEHDIALAQMVLSKADDLFKAKALQMHFSIRSFLSEIGVDISGIPLFFSSTPNLHLQALDESHEFFSMLSATLRNAELRGGKPHENRRLYASLVHEDKPWIIKTPCPNCGIQSKYIIKTRLTDDMKSFRSVCQTREVTLRNEIGWETGKLKGCGHEWHEDMPHDPKEMAAFLKSRAVGMHFPINMSIMLMRSGLPIVGSLFEDPGWIYNGNGLEKVPDYPTGDNPDMIMSVMATQLAVACGRMGNLPAESIVSALPLMMSQHRQIMDPLIKQRKMGQETDAGTTNSSITALYRHGMTPLQIFESTLSMQHYPFTTIMDFRRKLDVPEMIREAQARGIYVARW